MHLDLAVSAIRGPTVVSYSIFSVFLLYYSLLRVSAGTTSRSFRSTTTCRSSSDWKRELTEPIGLEDIIMQEENPVTEYLIN
jgi:hypothetical protein